MSLSLRDQLLQAGLVTEKQVKQAEQQQQRRPAQQQSKRQREQASEQQKLVQQRAAAEKAARDQELARKQQEKADRKARWAQVRQLIEQHKLPRVDSEDYFHFTDGRAIKRIAVDAALRVQLQAGTLRISRCDGKYELLPAEAAERIREREPAAILKTDAAAVRDQSSASAADDPYKDHVVPDDLMW